MAVIKKLPANEPTQVTTTNVKGEVYVTTRKTDNNLFYLYKKVPTGYEKNDKGRKNPLEFDPIIWTGNKPTG